MELKPERLDDLVAGVLTRLVCGRWNHVELEFVIRVSSQYHHLTYVMSHSLSWGGSTFSFMEPAASLAEDERVVVMPQPFFRTAAIKSGINHTGWMRSLYQLKAVEPDGSASVIFKSADVARDYEGLSYGVLPYVSTFLSRYIRLFRPGATCVSFAHDVMCEVMKIERSQWPDYRSNMTPREFLLSFEKLCRRCSIDPDSATEFAFPTHQRSQTPHVRSVDFR